MVTRRGAPVGWITLGLFLAACALAPILARNTSLDPEIVMTVFAWVAFGMVPVCLWYYGRTSTALPRRGGSTDGDLVKGFFWGGWIILAICAVIAIGGSYGAASMFAILLGLNSLAIAAARRTTVRRSA